MGDDEHRGLLGIMAILAHSVDRDPRIAHNRGHFGQGAGLIEQLQAQIKWRRCCCRGRLRFYQSCRGLPKGIEPQAAREIQHI